MEIKISNPEQGIKDILAALKDNNVKIAICDPKTVAYLMDGFEAKGMEKNEVARTHRYDITEICDLGFCKIFMDPHKAGNSPSICYTDVNTGEECQIDLVFGFQMY